MIAAARMGAVQEAEALRRRSPSRPTPHGKRRTIPCSDQRFRREGATAPPELQMRASLTLLGCMPLLPDVADNPAPMLNTRTPRYFRRRKRPRRFIDLLDVSLAPAGGWVITGTYPARISGGVLPSIPVRRHRRGRDGNLAEQASACGRLLSVETDLIPLLSFRPALLRAFRDPATMLVTRQDSHPLLILPTP